MALRKSIVSLWTGIITYVNLFYEVLYQKVYRYVR